MLLLMYLDEYKAATRSNLPTSPPLYYSKDSTISSLSFCKSATHSPGILKRRGWVGGGEGQESAKIYCGHHFEAV